MRRDLSGDRATCLGPMPVRRCPHRDRLPGFLGLARSFPCSRLAHGAAYATYVGSWRKRFRIADGIRRIVRYEDKDAGTTRAFCGRCGTPLFYQRKRSPHMVNIPRALFQSRTGRPRSITPQSRSCRTGPIRADLWFRSRAIPASSGSVPGAGGVLARASGCQNSQENFLRASLTLLPPNATYGLFVL